MSALGVAMATALLWATASQATVTFNSVSLTATGTSRLGGYPDPGHGNGKFFTTMPTLASPDQNNSYLLSSASFQTGSNILVSQTTQSAGFSSASAATFDLTSGLQLLINAPGTGSISSNSEIDYTFTVDRAFTISLNYDVSLTSPFAPTNVLQLRDMSVNYLVNFSPSADGSYTSAVIGPGQYVFVTGLHDSVDGPWTPRIGQSDSLAQNVAFQINEVSPTPEPASWEMMIAGFGLMGGGIRVRRSGQITRSIRANG